ncbi:MAG TPA: extracellular solute-binding protein [Thermomicrobiales bacterium]|nr:extracellular solute-binding protein [Thermomicrobiales bacterium]
MENRNMSGDRTALNELLQAYLDGRLSRRQLAARAAALGVSVPALGALLSARPTRAQDATPATGEGASPEAAADECGPFGDYEGQTLRISVALAETEAAVFQEVIDAFQEMTGGEIERVNIESEDVIRTLEAQVESGNVEIDLLTQDNNSLAPLVDQGLVEPIPNAEEILPETTIEALKPVLQFDGTYYFLPARPNVQITYYNENLFEQYGVEPPQTWEELLQVAQTIEEQAGVGQVSIQGVPGGAVGVTVTQFLWQAGADPLNINTPEAVQAFEFLQELEPYLTPQYPTATFDTTNTYILNESVALAQNWPFGVNVIVQEGGKEEVKTYDGWEGPAGNALVLGGDVFGIVKGTPNKEFALDFARYFMCREVQEKLVAELGWPAIRTDAFAAVEEWQQPYFETIREALEVAQPRPNVTYWPEVERILTDAFNDIVTGGAPVEETLDRYQEEIEALKSGG